MQIQISLRHSIVSIKVKPEMLNADHNFHMPWKTSDWLLLVSTSPSKNWAAGICSWYLVAQVWMDVW